MKSQRVQSQQRQGGHSPQSSFSAAEASQADKRLNGTAVRKLPWLAAAAIAVSSMSTSQTARAEDSSQPGGENGDRQPGTSEKAAGEQGSLRTVHHFQIAAGTLGEVASALEKETGRPIHFAVEKLAQVPSPGVQGVLTLEEALQKALDKTGVSARILSDQNIVLDLSAGSETVEVSGEIQSMSPKYTAPLLDLPQTLSIISQDVMQMTAASSLVEALRTVPGITFGAGEGGNPIGDRPFIRGMDSQSSTFIDGMRDVGSQSREVFDIESIEVSEGPGGAYGGRGTAGGSINMNSKMAMRKNSIEGSFTPGTADYKRATVDVNHQLGSSVAARLNGVWHNADVAGRDGVKSDRWGVAPSIALGLGTPTRVYLNYYHLVTNNIPDTGVPYNNPTFVARTDGMTQVLQKGDGSPVTLPNRRAFYGLLDRDKDRETAKEGTVRAERDLWGGSSLLRNTVRYGRTGQDYIVTQPDDSKGNIYYGMVWRRPNTRVSSVYAAINQTDLSGTFKTGTVKHSYAAGAEFSQERGNNDSYTVGTGSNTACPSGEGAASAYNCTDLYAPNMHDPWAGSIVLAHNPTRSKTVTKSAYAFDTMNLMPKLQTTLGIRYDNYSSSYQSAVTSGVRTTYKREDNLVNYQAALTYKPIAKASLYGSVTTSSVPSGNSLAQGSDSANLQSTTNANLEPMRTREEEIGAKWEFSGGRAMLKADGFRSDIDNVRITQADGTIAMAGKDRTYGAEISISGNVTRKWEVFGGYTYLDAILVQAGGSGTANGLADGSAFPNTPRHSASITSNYRVLSKLRLGGGVYAMSKVWGSQVNNKWVPGYVREDLFGDYQFNRHINLQVNVLNLSDKLYYDKAYPTHYASMAPGRSAQASLNFKF